MMMVAPSFAQNDAGPIFEDKFDKGNANGWHIINWGNRFPGNFSITENSLKIQVPDYAGAMAVAPRFSFSENYHVIEADAVINRAIVDSSAGGGPDGFVGLGETYGAGLNGYYMYTGAYDRRYIPGAHMCIGPVGSASRGRAEQCVPLPSPIVPGKKYNLRFEREGPAIRGYLDGAKVIEYNAEELPPGENVTPYVWVFEGAFTWNDFKVYVNKTPELEVVGRKLYSPSIASQDSRITANATIRNSGRGNATAFDAVFYSSIGGMQKEECRRHFDRLNVNESASLSCAINASEAGYLDLSITIDPEGRVVETDKTNNSATARVVVTPKVDNSIWLIAGAAAIVLVLIGIGTLFVIYKALTHTVPSGKLVACKRCGMMLSPDTKKCPVCGEGVGQAS